MDTRIVIAILIIFCLAAGALYYVHQRQLNACIEEVFPAEDLMYEHGILRRILLIYEACIKKADAKETIPYNIIHQGASIVHSFIEEYHEKQEENYIFVLFEPVHALTPLVTTLRKQHVAGRVLTQEILRIASQNAHTTQDISTLVTAMKEFIHLYRPHASREDTEIFPAIRGAMSAEQYQELSEQFEKSEHALIGMHGFQEMLDLIKRFEKELGINDLATYSPRSS